MILCQNAVNVINNTDPDISKWLFNLGHCNISRFDRFGQIEDINEAVSVLGRMVGLLRDEDPSMHAALSILASSLQKRFRLSGNLDDLVQAILFQQLAVNITADSHPNKPELLNNLGTFTQSRFERLGDVEDLNKAVSFKQTAVNLTPDGHPNRPLWLSNLGSAIQSRFERFGDIGDLETGISLYQAAIDLTSDSHLDRPCLLINLGNSVQARFKRLGDVRDLERAISLLQAAVDLMPDGHPNKPGLLNDIGNSFQSRFECLGNIKDLERAILFQQAAVDLAPNGHPDEQNWLNNLGISFQLRFGRLGDVRDLERAISLKQDAVDRTPDHHPNKPELLNTLGKSLRSRFERLGDIEDLDRVVSLRQAAVELVPDGHPSKTRLLNSLGVSVLSRFQRLGKVEDLEKALSFQRAAVESTPDDHPDKPARLSSLGSIVELRFQRLGEIRDLERAISVFQAAINLIPDGHPDKPGMLNNLGGSVYSRFERFGDVGDLEKGAISFYQEAFDLTPQGYPLKADILSHLGELFLSRFYHTNCVADLQRAISFFSSSATSLTGSSVTRFESACLWAILLRMEGKKSLHALEYAINLLPGVAWLGMPITSQYAELTKSGNIVRYAVAVAIELEEYETALEWAEYGRSIVWQNLLGLRNPSDDLGRIHPKLASQLKGISQKLEESLSRSKLPKEAEPASLQEVASRASILAAEWDRIIEEVRKLPDFENFLKAKTFDKLTPAAYEGPVAIINVHRLRSDALILIPHDSQDSKVSIVHIPLQSFSRQMSVNLLHDFSRLLSSAEVRARDTRRSERVSCFVDREDAFKRILHSLWLHVAKPILDGLAYKVRLPTHGPGDHSRIWWCATGSLAFLPIHAAGNYDSDIVGEKISDYVISSYTPTLTAILEQSQPYVTDDFQILTVAQPSTPYASRLPNTEIEINQIKEIVGVLRVESLISEEATTVRVLQAMKESNWIHLACHGVQDHKESMKSGFLLHDKTLELSELIREPLPKAEFAFLSACQTAKGDEKVAEESVHLAAGMLFSGCKGVIGTMWSIQDEDAPKVTKAVYERMLKDGKANRKEAARALHEAVKELRESGADFLSWVPFIHMGR
ncbi:hypothetical protein M408DRAFT_82013 [Serendipita vermifera MAFF 305830]|uniref:CHAT domain-containing protein n=1 Tax=Serendipita vermifera MAFF 305830 TaxID=933852 RepID=A0A0C3A739_SERVB|nr:hypothetical protein M408DRAFT_82013 [Serendipita vermifera MAFF 305830]